MNEPVVQSEQTILDGVNLLTDLLLSSVGIFIKICIVLLSTDSPSCIFYFFAVIYGYAIISIMNIIPKF
mgnify:CR=1 FL=1